MYSHVTVALDRASQGQPHKLRQPIGGFVERRSSLIRRVAYQLRPRYIFLIADVKFVSLLQEIDIAASFIVLLTVPLVFPSPDLIMLLHICAAFVGIIIHQASVPGFIIIIIYKRLFI